MEPLGKPLNPEPSPLSAISPRLASRFGAAGLGLKDTSIVDVGGFKMFLSPRVPQRTRASSEGSPKGGILKP